MSVYRQELDYTVSGFRGCTRTSGGQLCICSHALLTAVAVMVEIYQTRCGRAIPALDVVSSEAKGLRGGVIPDPEDSSGSLASKCSKIFERWFLVTVDQAINSPLHPCGDFVRSPKMDLLDGR